MFLIGSWKSNMQAIPTYVVTGATRGIGRAVAKELAGRGFRVFAVGRSVELLQSLSEACGSRVTTVAADLCSIAGVEQLLASVPSDSEIAGLVHSAGSLVPLQPYEQINMNELAEHFRIHVGVPIELFNSLSRDCTVKRMLFIDSYSASNVRPGWGAYSIVKAAAQMAARCAAQELPGTHTIRAYPGAVNTRIVDAVLASDTQTASTFASMREKGEFAEPEDVARFLVALLVDATDELIGSRDVFDYNNPGDRADVFQLTRS
ncbi:Short-chain dehydrogenase/reductase SDR [Rhodopirellula baltica SWK14]|uniref:Short-chain dehydrogenase/reductase SDR n=2 Tax=Rhodopirellula baltica TaxID=265606 RepID=L7CGW4_RHOBT|nr:Short-chain dehydrogenase/reductase SDR [Rhodopirellula baltica SWK14]